MTQFNDFDFHPHLLKAIEKAGFDTPTPVQQQSMPHALEGADILACAQTGTGKTAAFCLPTVSRLLSQGRAQRGISPRALVLTPTRELANQVLDNLKTFVAGTSLKVGMIVGGMPYPPQIRMLEKKLDIMVATPGRLMDHMGEGRVDLSQIEVVVLDEADRMLDMGFSKPVEEIISTIDNKPQTLLFSATFDKSVEKLAKKFLENPAEVKLADTTQKHDNIEQTLFFTRSKQEKMHIMQGILANNGVWQAIVFMRTKHAADDMAAEIASWGYRTAALHGDMRQNVRKRVIERMHKGLIEVLVATDVAARGIDVKDLSHVINFDLPQVAEDYIHRIGRTGRAGAKGVAYSFVSKQEMHLLRGIEKILGEKIKAQNDVQAAPIKKKSADEKKAESREQKRKPNPRKRLQPKREEGEAKEARKPAKPKRKFNKPRAEGEEQGGQKPFRNKPRPAKGNTTFKKREGEAFKKDGDKPTKPKRSFNKSKPRPEGEEKGGKKSFRSKPRTGQGGGAARKSDFQKGGGKKAGPRRDGVKPRGARPQPR